MSSALERRPRAHPAASETTGFAAIQYGAEPPKTIEWEDGASERMKRIPAFVRGMVVKAVEDSDNQRAQFLRRFYDVRQESPAHYDIVVNTDVLSPEDAARLVLTAVKG